MASAPDIEEYFGAGSPPPAVPDGQEVGRWVREYLDAVRAHVEALHAEDGPASTVNATHSDLLDALLRRLFEFADDEAAKSGSERERRMAMVAVGGYARREMALHSDIDLLFLHPRRLTDSVRRISERVQLWLWDAGLTVGSAVRTVNDTRKLAAQDATVRTSVLDARLLCGEPALCEDLRRRVRRDVQKGAPKLIEGRMAAIQDRHTRYEETPYLLQPNLKEGTGGLRDYHAACWVTVAAYDASGTLGAFEAHGLLTSSEVGELRDALEFFWRVRNELHRISGRKNDELSFQMQDEISRNFGYDEVVTGHDLPVERFMSDYYRHARRIRNYSELVIHQCLRHVRPPRRRSLREVERGFRIVGDELEIPSSAHLRADPVNLLAAFSVAQQHDVELSRTALRLVRENLDLVDDRFRNDPEAGRIFVSIVESEHRVTRTLFAMNETRLLGAYIPEWNHIVCRWQHVMYHTYTVDVHSILLVEELRRLWKGEHRQLVPDLSELIHVVPDRAALYLGCLFHDLGKGLGGDHSEKGLFFAATVMQRLGMAPERILRACYLVRYHLLMSHVAQRRDLSDPKLIIEFARLSGDRTNLRNLYLCTFADMRASSRTGWTDWRGFLLRELFERTSEFLETGGDDLERAIEQVQRRVDLRRESARGLLAQEGIDRAAIDGFFQVMPQRYFISHTPRQIARHAKVFVGYDPAKGLTTAVREVRGGLSEFIVCTPDRHGLYATVAGSLTANRVNILGSHVYTTRSGLALEIYRVTTPAGGPEERALTWQSVERTLGQALGGELDLGQRIRELPRPVGVTRSPAQSPQSIGISNQDSDFYTVVDVSANDRSGLLFDLTRTIADLDFEVYISKASTILDQVADTFYLKDLEGKKVTDPAQLELLRRKLEGVVHGQEAGGG